MNADTRKIGNIDPSDDSSYLPNLKKIQGNFEDRA